MSTKHEGFTPEQALDIITSDASIGAFPLYYDLNALRDGITNVRAENQRLRALLAQIDGELSDLRLFQVAVPRLRAAIRASLTEPDA